MRVLYFILAVVELGCVEGCDDDVVVPCCQGWL
jgi:hypothetical protein